MIRTKVPLTMEGEARKPNRCRAAVCRKPGELLTIEEVMMDPPMPSEIRIRFICTLLCHSDITFWKMKDPPACFPRILSHEAIRIVERVGENVMEVAIGDTVFLTFMSDCGECADCNSKKSNLCSKFPFKLSPWMSRYESSRFKDLNGDVLCHFLFVLSFSEYTVVDVANVVKGLAQLGRLLVWIFGLGSIRLDANIIDTIRCSYLKKLMPGD